jgi:hypothetical protein
MKKLVTVLFMISLLLFSGCIGFSFTRVSETTYGKNETLWVRLHYTTVDGQVINIYEYAKPGVDPENYELNNEVIATLDNVHKNGIKTIFDLF